MVVDLSRLPLEAELFLTIGLKPAVKHNPKSHAFLLKSEMTERLPDRCPGPTFVYFI